MTEKELLPKIKQVLNSLFQEVSVLKNSDIKEELALSNDSLIDILVTLEISGVPVYWLVELKSIGEPRMVRSYVQASAATVDAFARKIGIPDKEIETRIYRLFAAPYVSSDSAAILKENGIGYVDLAGNSYVNFGSIYIERKDFPNLRKEKRIARSVFAPKASRVLRVMLSNPQKLWQLKELAAESSVSIGEVFKVKERLLDMEYAAEKPGGLGLNRPGELLKKWSENYNFRKNAAKDYYASGETKEIEQKISDYCLQNGIDYAFTLFSGAALVAPYTQYSRVFVYVKGAVDETFSGLGFKAVDSGPNVTVLRPYDEGIFYGVREVNGKKTVGDIQLYLDLKDYKGRGDEAAEFLFNQRIGRQW